MNDNHKHHSRLDLEEIWDQVPPDYYQNGIKRNFLQYFWHTRKLKSIIDIVDIEPNNILDVGCASGWFLSEISLVYPKAKCTGVDVYKKAIDYGKKTYKKLKLVQADAHNLPFKKNSFDLVICTEVLEHVVDPEKVLGEIKRVLTNDGIAIVEMDSGNFLFKAVWYLWTNARNGVWHHSHIYQFNAKKLERMIEKNGFAIAQKKSFNFSMAVAFNLKLKNKI
ncbi:MAG: methyltransferase domain-containing protein [Patescibacteria group bacterium]